MLEARGEQEQDEERNGRHKKTHLEMTMTILRSKTTLDRINNWLNTVEEKISDLEDTAIEIVQNEE